ncbi:hypothetical protein H072_7328 [Dactylellina haptotyla CBS 200.50]|uniref:Uncharacterized protein n=1 Tax=Dactylellina haptotyla (strain CBS 200.50) TaxID=1284197 RepID=S8A7G6_DACHA|nr:hypothetical protein H072_7328 [Dactylellina haptotyla CBS 200.50]
MTSAQVITTQAATTVATKSEIVVEESSTMAAVLRVDPQVETSVNDFQTFISFVFSISIFGASTFAIILGEMTDPADIWKPDSPPFSLPQVRNFLAISWLCFILSIAVAAYSSSILTIFRQRANHIYEKSWYKTWDVYGLIASAILHLLLVMAFLFLSVALVAYVGTVGWVAVGFSAGAGVFVLGLTAYQCM